MPSRPTLLAALSLPVGAIAYTVGARLIAAVWPTEGFFILIIPLFLAGLVMMPLLIPFFDRKAKQDLAEYRAAKEAAEQAEPAGPPADTGPDPDTGATP